jgi:CheY-like chemotaxis protein
MSAKTILSVGQCNMDHGSLSRLIHSLGGEVQRVHTATEALTALEERRYALVLVNRVFDADGGDGQALIRRIKESAQEQAVMLVSNFPEAQAEAEKAGAAPGFGKASLDSPETAEKLRAYLA